VITFHKQEHQGCSLFYYWVSVHFGSFYNCILLNSGTPARKIKWELVQYYFNSHTSFPVSQARTSLQRLSKHDKK
jgi:hypothetical protein